MGAEVERDRLDLGVFEIPSSGDCETHGRRAACDLSGDWPLCVVDLCRYAGVESKIQNVCLLLCHAIANGDHRFRVACSQALSLQRHARLPMG